MTNLKKFFLKPHLGVHHQYEIQRASSSFDALPVADIAARFNVSVGTVYNLIAKLRKTPTLYHFRVNTPGPKPKVSTPDKGSRDERIVALRQDGHLTAEAIRDRLKRDGVVVGINTVYRVIRDAGLPRLRRCYWGDASPAPATDHRTFVVISGQFETGFGGLFLFARDLNDLNLTQAAASLPGSTQLPAACIIRALLALKM